MRCDVPVSFSDRNLGVVPEILSQFPADCRPVAAKGTCDLGLTDPLLLHTRKVAAFVQTQLHRSAGLKPWPLLSSLHLKVEPAINRFKTFCNDTGISYGEALDDLMRRAKV